MKKTVFKTIILLLLSEMTVVSCYKEKAIPVTANFSAEYVDSNKTVPVQINITNLSEGAESYEWTFEGGVPETSTKQDPGVITYEKPGEYPITLTVSNQDGSKDVKTIKIQTYDAFNIDFTTQIVNNQANYPPVEIHLINHTEGEGLTYAWTFEGGKPNSSTDKDPANVTFSQPGNHNITLTVNNGVKSQSETQTITVAQDITADFSWKVTLDDDDYQVPVTLQMVNNSISATAYQWTFAGGSPSSSTQKEPSVTFASAGTYPIKLKADNGSNSQTIEKQLTVYPNTNLRIFSDVKLGINSAHNNNSFGAFFSTTTHEVYKANQINSTNGKDIELVFFGLNANFDYNKFISPDQALNNGFSAISNAQHTIFVNSQELCNCGLNFTAAAFDSMTNDNPLKTLNITETPAGMQQFGNVLPRIVLFKTQDGRKGAVKIKQMVSNGTSSYIVCDIKVQKSSD